MKKDEKKSPKKMKARRYIKKTETKKLKARRDIKKPSAKKMKARRYLDSHSETQGKKKLTKKRIVLISVLSVIAILVLAIGGILIFSSPSIDTDRTPFNVGIMDMFGTNDAYNFTNSYRLDREHTIGVIYTLEDFFGRGLFVGETDPDSSTRNKNAYNVLVVGKDRVGANTDVIMVVNFNTSTQKVNVLQIPRDTYVEDPINRNLSKRVNAIYAFSYMQNIRKYKNAEEASHASLKYLESTIEDTFGITIDNYFMIDLNGFVKIINSIGGVEVDVPFNMYYNDEEQGLYINLKKGKQTLNGNQAEQFVRFRNTYVLGDLGRVSAQKIFLAALVEKLMSPEWYSIDSLTSVASDLIEYSTTGLTLTDLIGYIKKIDFKRFSADSITFYTAPGEGFFTSGGASMYSLYLKENLEIINKAFNLYNKKITSDHMTLCEKYRSAYAQGDTQGDTASDIEKEPPKIMVAGGGSSSSSSSKPVQLPQEPSASVTIPGVDVSTPVINDEVEADG